MKKSFIVVATLFCLIGLITTNAYSVEDNSQGIINVSYTEEKEVTPDTAEISIAVMTEDKVSLAKASTENKRITDSLYKYLKSVINSNNGDYIKTTNYTATPEYTYNNGKRNFEKYQVSNTVIIHTKNIENLTTVIDKVLELGATDINSLNFYLSEKDKYCNELLKTAVTKAKTRAEITAQAAGVNIIGIKTLDTSCNQNQPRAFNYSRKMLYAANALEASDATDVGVTNNIEPGIIKVYSSVNITYYVK